MGGTPWPQDNVEKSVKPVRYHTNVLDIFISLHVTL
jgi:hypothetical protein